MTGLAAALLLASNVSAPPLEQLYWLAGCWEQKSEQRLSEEHWMPARGGTMLGMSRTVARGATVAWEHLHIEDDDGVLVLTAYPSGQKSTQFVQSAIGTGTITFENPDHDFPQKITYAVQPDGSLLATISGGEGESARSVEFPMWRVDCD